MESKKIKKGDFIEIDYTGKIKDGGIVFDTTYKKVADENKLSEKNAVYEPIRICIGEGHLIKGLDARLDGKALGKYSFEIPPEEGFGRKSGNLLKLVPIKVFKQQNIAPFPGLEINIDNMFGIVRTVSGGRVIVDFNHPLASRDLVYDVKVNRIITDDKEKAEALLKIGGVHFDSVSVVAGKAMIVVPHDVPKQVQDAFKKDLLRLTKMKNVVFKKKEAKK